MFFTANMWGAPQRPYFLNCFCFVLILRFPSLNSRAPTSKFGPLASVCIFSEFGKIAMCFNLFAFFFFEGDYQKTGKTNIANILKNADIAKIAKFGNIANKMKFGTIRTNSKQPNFAKLEICLHFFKNL